MARGSQPTSASHSHVLERLLDRTQVARRRSRRCRATGAGSQHPFGGGDAGRPRVEGDGLPQSLAESFEHRLDGVMRVTPGSTRTCRVMRA